MHNNQSIPPGDCTTNVIKRLQLYKNIYNLIYGKHINNFKNLQEISTQNFIITDPHLILASLPVVEADLIFHNLLLELLARDKTLSIDGKMIKHLSTLITQTDLEFILKPGRAKDLQIKEILVPELSLPTLINHLKYTYFSTTTEFIKELSYLKFELYSFQTQIQESIFNILTTTQPVLDEIITASLKTIYPFL